MNTYEGEGAERVFHFDGHPNDFRTYAERYGQPTSFEIVNKIRVTATFSAPE